jgi:cobalamin biosynthesis protein CobT
MKAHMDNHFKLAILDTLRANPQLSILEIMEDIRKDKKLAEAFLSLTISEIQDPDSAIKKTKAAKFPMTASAAKIQELRSQPMAEPEEDEDETEAETEDETEDEAEGEDEAEDEAEDEDEAVEAAEDDEEEDDEEWDEDGEDDEEDDEEEEEPAAKKKAAAKKAPVGRPKKAKAAEEDEEDAPFDLRTEEGREQYDKTILKAIKKLGDKVSSADIRDAVGGKMHQLRAGLNRLIEAGEIAYEGNTRATRYFLVE